ncbi:MAG: fluoride efflux transporter CrcB [Saccharospirillum sp.]
MMGVSGLAWFAVALGGSLGALGRFALALAYNRLPGSQFPWGTLIANLGGSFLIGMAFVFFSLRTAPADDPMRSLIVVGLLGAFTTFSTFAIETVVLAQQALWSLAIGYFLASVMGSLIAALLGVGVGKLVF